jgi:hyperosmotically inducible periplasmic protein
MNSQTTGKVIVASGMVAVIGIGVLIFALRSHPAASVAQAPQPLTPPVAQIPAPAPDATAPIPAAPPAAQIPEAPALVAHDDSASTKGADAATAAAVVPEPAHKRHLARADTTPGIVTRAGTAADTSDASAIGTAASSVDPAKSAVELTPPPANSNSVADDQKVGTSVEVGASDSQITTDVKSEIAADGLSKDANIGVSTAQGVVMLTGSLASQDAINHVKDLAGKVKDVKSVDTSALVLASL